MGRGKATSSSIEIYLRLRPVARPAPYVELEPEEAKIDFHLPRDIAAGLVNNQREHYEFHFNGLIGMEAKQDEVFERVARPACLASLEGINSTIFAYGQTGSGKTFTITGGPERYVDRGIIPRSLSLIFQELSNRADAQFAVHISYLEIYNDVGYDLLDPNREVKMLEDLPKVSMLEDEDGNVHMRNLSMHRAANEEDALNLLFLGDTNRTISETPMNMASSRSHCIFSVYIEAREGGKDIVKRSKLNLVDLAGSERVSKTNVDGTTLREAKYINLSLHYLEQVIIALQEKSMGKADRHIPYRNSMMTTVLRDSLGGNCRTTMVATINTKSDQIDESISTCRFAQRVAMISNKVMVNEELDPSLVIKRLKAEIKDLKEEIRMLSGEEEERGPLTPDELGRMKDTIVAYCSDPSPEATLSIGGNMTYIRAAFQAFKEMMSQGGSMKGFGGSPNGGGGDDTETIRKLKLQVQHRDNEIGILVSMLKKLHSGGGLKGGGGDSAVVPMLGGNAPAIMAAARSSTESGQSLTAAVAAAAAVGGGGSNGAPLDPATGGWEEQGLRGTGPSLHVGAAGPRQAWGEEARPAGGGGGGGSEAAAPSSTAGSIREGMDPDAVELVDVLANTDLLKDRNKAFELFRKSYRKNEVIEENKALLKQKYELAKALGGKVNSNKKRINELKALIEQRRVQRAVGGLTDGQQAASEPDREEESAKLLIEKEKATYKETFSQLRELKSEIEHLQMLLEQSRGKLQKDFEQWMGVMLRQRATSTTPRGSPAKPAPSLSPETGSAQSPAVQTIDGSQGLPALAATAAQQGPKLAWGDTPTQATGGKVSKPHQGSAGENPFAGAVDLSRLDPEVRAAAEPWLTGNAEADENIIKFYEAKVALMRGG